VVITDAIFGVLVLLLLFGGIVIADTTSRQPRCDCAECERARDELPPFIGTNW
jgi:hypothetical protein